MSDTRRRRHNSNQKGRQNTEERSQVASQQLNSPRGFDSNVYRGESTDDQVRKIVQEEGRTARNLIAYNVPIIRNDHDHGKKKSRNSTKQVKGVSKLKVGLSPNRRSLDAGSDNSRPSSVNSNKGKKGDLRARYWAFLFENLKRAVDEIYQMCEADESVVECKEVIMVLEQCTKDFQSLIKRMDLQEAYEKADQGHKPLYIAWEVRKTSPGKGLLNNTPPDRDTPSPTVSRNLNFSSITTHGNSEHNTKEDIININKSSLEKKSAVYGAGSEMGGTWADRVKAPPPTPYTKPLAAVVKPEATKPTPEEEDANGWETVQRTNRARIKNSPVIESPGSKFKSLSSPNQPLEGSKYKNQKQSGKPGHESNIKNGAKGRGKRMSQSSRSLENLEVGHKGRMRPKSKGSKKEVNGFPVNSEVCEQDTSLNEDLHNYSEIVRDDKVALYRSHSVDETCLNGIASPKVVLNECVVNKMENSLTEESAAYCEDNGGDNGDDSTAKLHEALASALSEEDNLTQQIEDDQEAALQSALLQEETYLKEIEKEESEEIQLSDSELDIETDSDLGNTLSSLEASQPRTMDWDSMVKTIDEEMSSRPSTNWADMVEDAECPESRTPGHGVHMHEKLSSPSRKRSATEKKRRSEQKQEKAQHLREKLQQEKTERLKELFKKVEEVRATKDGILHQRRATTKRKLERAEEKRQLNLKMKVKKAREEETKANEIAFINQLGAQNKRHDILSKLQVSDARSHDIQAGIQEERQRKHEEKLAKETAVEERRKVLEAERLARLQELQERRKQRFTKIEQIQQEKEKERMETARAKERAKEERLAVLNAQQQQHIVELQKKIQQKQDDSAKRHTAKLAQISLKAFEMTVLKHTNEDHNDAPKLLPYETSKLCTICNVLIPSEVHLQSHLRGKKHQQTTVDMNGGKAMSQEELELFNLKHITDATDEKTNIQMTTDRERQRTLKKRCKKLRQRMMARGSDYENAISGKQGAMQESEHRAKLQKVNKDMIKYLQAQGSGPWPQTRTSALDRALGEIGRIMEKRINADQLAFRLCGGVTTLVRILLEVYTPQCTNPQLVIPSKTLALLSNVLRLASRNCYDTCHYMLFSNKVGSLVDVLTTQLTTTIPEDLDIRPASSGVSSNAQSLPYDSVSMSLMQLLASVLSCLARNNPVMNSSEASAERTSSSGDAYMSRAHDIVSYIVSTGIVDRLTIYFNNVREPIDADTFAGEFLQHSIGFLVGMAKLISKRNSIIFAKKRSEDTTHLVETFQVTDLVGIVSLLYGMLLHSAVPERGSVKPPQLPQHVLSVIVAGIRMLNHMATLDLKMLQNSLGEEGISLEFRHICSYLIWYCSHWMSDELLHEVILCVGYFTVLCLDNQVIVQSGQPPTVLQQLCTLPFQYFSDPRLTAVLFPTLIACCFNNQHNQRIMEQELSCTLLSNFIEEKQLEIQQAQLAPSKKIKTSDKEKARETDWRMALPSRFPEEKWDAAHQYFHVD